jgi:hypothetical protein
MHRPRRSRARFPSLNTIVPDLIACHMPHTHASSDNSLSQMWRRVGLMDQDCDFCRIQSHLQSPHVAFALAVLLRIVRLRKHMRDASLPQHSIKTPLQFCPIVCPDRKWRRIDRQNIKNGTGGANSSPAGETSNSRISWIRRQSRQSATCSCEKTADRSAI